MAGDSPHAPPFWTHPVLTRPWQLLRAPQSLGLGAAVSQDTCAGLGAAVKASALLLPQEALLWGVGPPTVAMFHAAQGHGDPPHVAT